VEYWLNVSFKLKRETSWAPLGHEIAWDQLALPASAAPAPFAAPKASFLGLADGSTEATLSGKDFSLRVDKQAGVITSYRYKGVTLLERGPLPDFWRAPTANDRGAWKLFRERATGDRSLNIELWREAGPRWDVKEVRVERVDDGSARITVAAGLPVVGGSYTISYLVYGTGDVVVECNYAPGDGKLSMMPRFGTELIAGPGLENIAWYGRGPRETLIDRQFERIGVYRSTVDDQWVEYMRPQENGSKTDVRWVKLTNAQGIGLIAWGEPTLQVSARHFSKEDMERAGYSFQMRRHPEIYLNLDWKMMGAGGIDSWSENAYPMAAYRINGNETVSYRYRLSPVALEAPAGKP
jgi:beta-galactosidase